MNRDIKFDSVRSFCNILVVVAHSWAVDQYCAIGGLEYWLWRTVNATVCCLAPTLFLMSGYLAGTSYDPTMYAKRLLGRVKRLAVPYAAWNVLYALFYLMLFSIVPRLAQRVQTFGLTTASGFVSKTIGIVAVPIDGPLWYLRAVLGYFFLLPLVMWIVRKCGWKIAWCLILVLGIFLHASGIEVLNGKCYPFYGFSIYILGVYLAERKIKPYELFANKWLLIFPMCSICLGLGLFIGVIPDYYNIPRTLYWYFHIPLLWIFAQAIDDWFRHFPLADWFKGGSGYFVYASHFLVCGSILHTVAPLLKGHWPGKFFLLVCVFFCGLPVIALIRRVGIKLFPRVMDIFDGTLK